MKNTLMLLKIYIQRSLSYLSIINAGMILFLVNDKLIQYGITKNNTITIILFITGIIACLIIGYLDTKLGLYEAELQINPIMSEILTRIKKIEKKQNEMQRL